MAGSLKKGKGKRGIPYPRRRMDEMIDQGLTIREMAEILGTDSLHQYCILSKMHCIIPALSLHYFCI